MPLPVEPDMTLLLFDVALLPRRGVVDFDIWSAVELEIAPVSPDPIVFGAIVPGLIEPGMDPAVDPGVDPGIDPIVDPGMLFGLLVVPGAVVTGPEVVDWAEAAVARATAAADTAIVLKGNIVFSFCYCLSTSHRRTRGRQIVVISIVTRETVASSPNCQQQFGQFLPFAPGGVLVGCPPLLTR
jgi:hypothetical protein